MKESSEVVLLLLQFMHRQRQPEMSNLPFEVFAELADAVEKYVVFSAMGVCKKKMECVSCYYLLELLLNCCISEQKPHGRTSSRGSCIRSSL